MLNFDPGGTHNGGVKIKQHSSIKSYWNKNNKKNMYTENKERDTEKAVMCISSNIKETG